MLTLSVLFWRRRGPHSWYSDENVLLRYLGKNVVALSVTFGSMALFIAIDQIYKTNRSLWIVPLVLSAILMAGGLILAFVMWFSSRPQFLIPPVFRESDRENRKAACRSE